MKIAFPCNHQRLILKISTSNLFEIGILHSKKGDNSRGGRGKLFIGASCATPNCCPVNVCMANVIVPREKSQLEISIYHVCSPVKVV